MRLEGRHGFVMPAREEDTTGEETVELKCEPVVTSSELAAEQRCGNELLAAFAVAGVLERRKLAHETFMEYKKALRRAAKGYSIPEPYYVVAFIKGVGCEDLAHLLREYNPENLDIAAKAAIMLERGDGAGPSTLVGNQKRPRAPATRDRRSPDHFQKRPRRDTGCCFVCHRFGHFARECPDQTRNGGRMEPSR